MDAAYVLEHAVGLLAPPFPGAGQVWALSPTGRSYPSMNASQTGQDFAGVLIGDISGNWGASAEQAVMRVRLAQEPVLTPGAARVSPGGRVSVAVQLSSDHSPLYSARLGIVYDPAVLSPVWAVKGEAAGDFAFAANLGETGVIRVAMAGAAPIGSAGTLVVLTFDAIAAAGTASNLQATEVLIDEQTASAVAHGRIAVILAEDLDADNAGCNRLVGGR